MKNWFFSLRIRTRLLIAYAGILLIGFAALTLVAGQQISSAAREDFEQRLQNEVVLVAQGLRGFFTNGRYDSDAVNQAVAGYETQTGAQIQLYGAGDGIGDDDSPHGSFRDYPELENALRDAVIVTYRSGSDGEERLYTAARVGREGENSFNMPLVQLSVSADALQALIWERWLSIGAIFLAVAALAVASATLLSRSLIQPLLSLRDSALKLSQGDLSHRVAYNHADEIGDVARAFNAMAGQVESMLEEQRAFASNTSHELRTPLTTIRLRTEALRDDPTLDADTAKQYISEIDDEVHRLGDLIEDLTLLSRFDAGRAELGREEIDLARFAITMKDRMLPHAEARKIDLKVEVPADEILPVRASLTHLTIVFRNVLENAIKYTPEGGSVTWRISAEGGRIRSAVRDTGVGISPDQLPHLFERFYRADRARTRNVPGTGLGLAIAKSVVEAYGGTIRIESAGISKGTTVTVDWMRAA